MNIYKPEGVRQIGILSITILLLVIGAFLLFTSAPIWMGLRMIGFTLMVFGGMYCLVMKDLKNPLTFSLSFIGVLVYITSVFVGT